MGHDHHHHHHSSHEPGSLSSLKLAFFLNLSFSLIEVFGGIMTGSIAILSDALHDFGDSLALGLAWYLEKYSHKKDDEVYNFGYRRFSLFGALLNILILVVGSVVLATQAFERLQDPKPVDALGMVGFAVLGVLVNGFGAWKVSRQEGFNHKIVFWHLMEDALGWVAILVAAGLIHVTGYHQLDPMLSLGINVFVLYNVFKRLKSIVPIFLQKNPSDLNLEEIREHLKKYPEVKDLHGVRAWSLDGQNHVLNCHIMIADSTSRERMIEIKHSTKDMLAKKKVQSTTIEFEFESEHCHP